MNEDIIDEKILEYEEEINKALSHQESEYDMIKAGRANPHVLDKIMVDYYGSPTPIKQMANISISEGRILNIAVWDVSQIKNISKAILASDIGINPSDDGKVIRLVFPQLTEERRKEIAKEEPSIVLIHDGVRPLINPQLLSQNIQNVKQFGSSITGAIVKETIVEIDDNGGVVLVPDRAHSRVAKAPQSFWLKDILDAHQKALSENIHDFIDSCTIMKHYGYSLHMTDGPYENIKITTPDDFYTMRAILQVKEDAQIYGLE